MRQSRVLVIVPALNEESNIGHTVESLRTCGISLDVLVVDDGSSDGTARVARETGAIVVSLPHNLGIGGAVQTGLIYARDRGYSYAMQFDGDGQHNSSAIPVILDRVIENETDVAIGSRFLCAGGFKSSAARRVGIRIFTAAIYLTTGLMITDSTSGFRAFNRQAIRFLAEHYPCDYPEVEAVVLLRRNGFRIHEYPVTMSERLHGVSSITLAKSVYYMLKVTLAIFVSAMRSREVPVRKL